MSRSFATVPTLMFLASCCFAQDKEEKKAWLAIMSKQAEAYEFASLRDKGEIQITEKPVFQHAAPSRKSDDIGGVWIWKDKFNRPIAAGTVFGWTAAPGMRRVIHEFCSLSRTKFEAKYNKTGEGGVWRPSSVAEWKPLRDAATPKKSLLRSQLKKESRRFAAHAFRGGERWQLRLVPTPVYQYETPELENTLGGAVFVICQDTNTDVVIGIEAVRPSKSQPYRFEYTLGSFTDMDLHVELDQKEVWQEAPSDPRGSRDLHWVRQRSPIRLNDAAAQASDAKDSRMKNKG